jgi:hypothetical protein
MSKPEQNHSNSVNSRYKQKIAVHKRDQHQCGVCAVEASDPEYFHAHHIGPRGLGGSDRFQNLSTLCPPCHKAIEGDGTGHVRTIRFATDTMDEYEFELFKHFVNHQIPALTRLVIEPEVPLRWNVADNDLWHVSAGDLRRLDPALQEASVEYKPLPEWKKKRPAEQTAAHHFM